MIDLDKYISEAISTGKHRKKYSAIMDINSRYDLEDIRTTLEECGFECLGTVFDSSLSFYDIKFEAGHKGFFNIESTVNPDGIVVFNGIDPEELFYAESGRKMTYSRLIFTGGLRRAFTQFQTSLERMLEYLCKAPEINERLSDIKAKWHPKEGLFTSDSPEYIANYLIKNSKDLKQAMNRLTFYMNRAGTNLKNKTVLDKAKKIIHSKIDAES